MQFKFISMFGHFNYMEEFGEVETGFLRYITVKSDMLLSFLSYFMVTPRNLGAEKLTILVSL